MAIEWKEDGFEVSTDPARLDLDVIHGFLSSQSYWAQGVGRGVVERSIANSIPFGVYRDGAQLAFARVISDRATFAWLADVFVLPAWRKHGLGKLLVRCIVAHPELQGLRRFLLGTRDAHGLYAQYGFRPLDEPALFMLRRL